MLMGFVGTVSFVAGVAFAMMGAWPVFGFFGLDVAIIYYAFRRNFQDAGACEVIEIRDHRLTIAEFDRKGRLEGAEAFNAAWVRLELSEKSGRRS